MILIKTQKDIDKIKVSCKIVAETLQLLKKNVKPGISTYELEKLAEDYILGKDAKSAFKGYSQGGAVPFPGFVCISVNDEVVHGIPSKEKVLKNGEIVSIDIGVVKDNYYGDAALSVPVGDISEESKKLLEVTEKSLYLGIEQAVADNRLHDISFAIQEHVESNGFSIVRDLSGHGVGKYLHEDPAVPNFGRKGTGVLLRKGMTIAIEPMVNAGTYKVFVGEDEWTILTSDGKNSAHFEHSILITDNKAEILTIA